MEDSVIIEMFFARSEQAIQRIDSKYGAYLREIAFRILRDMRDTEEIVNDTYMGAWKAIPPAKPESLKYFLSRIARNLAFDRLDYRMAGKRHALLVELEECIPDEKSNPERLREAKELGEALNRFLGTLDRRCCAVFLARYYYAYSIRELSDQYSMSERQVKYLLSKTRTKLRAFLEKEGMFSYEGRGFKRGI